MLFHQLERRNSERGFRDSGNVIQEKEDAAVIAGENSKCNVDEDGTNDANVSSASNEMDLNQQSYLSETNSETVIEFSDYTNYRMDVKMVTGTHHTPHSAYDSGSTNVIIEECGAITFEIQSTLFWLPKGFKWLWRRLYKGIKTWQLRLRRFYLF